MNHLRGDRGLNYGDYAYIENFIQDGWSTFPLPNIARRAAALRDLAAPGAAAERPVRAARGAVRDRQADPRGHPAGRLRGDEDVPHELLEPVGAGRVAPPRLRDRRRGHRQGPRQGAAGAPAQDEEGRRRRGRSRSTWRWRGCRSRSSPTRAQAVADKLVSGAPTPHHLRHAGTPPEIVAEDKLIERFPVPIEKENVKVVPVDKMFEK